MDPIVDVRPGGTVRGSTTDGTHVFLGIPYAAPPFGAHRLRPPRPVEAWSGVRDALTWGAKPPQNPYPPPWDTLIRELDGRGDDCLTLNVRTPEIGPAGLPVMVWITGGQFMTSADAALERPRARTEMGGGRVAGCCADVPDRIRSLAVPGPSALPVRRGGSEGCSTWRRRPSRGREEQLMTKYDSVVEAVIEATPSECWDALMDEAEGHSTWWRPYVTLRRRGDISADQVGSVLEVAANAHPERRIGAARWAERTVELEPGHRKVMENFDGAFRGTTTWTFEPLDSGRTHVTVRFTADPAGMMKLLSRLVDVNAVNRKVFDECFRGMQQHLAAKKSRSD